MYAVIPEMAFFMHGSKNFIALPSLNDRWKRINVSQWRNVVKENK
ncbi:hypothetical protein Cst_c14670 [Thermoclostridium stercorarium subsp. stercorarium DSM 8532]|uniref:Uncharacterized protein n=1 Tax=Thermoclostridium stercorarium (strain ATCC 35414 / DSM 8532 / NCIMB 11754) TaxID=1121335 RepID=L7VPT5_THES1|nr:hypothetical protein Cst_c14670 [Thermoclostridium stercorarium subsp. stercorarium DSM 8532]